MFKTPDGTSLASLSLSLSLSYLSTLSEDHLITANNARVPARPVHRVVVKGRNDHASHDR